MVAPAKLAMYERTGMPTVTVATNRFMYSWIGAVKTGIANRTFTVVCATSR
jgi:hypothetical protein